MSHATAPTARKLLSLLLLEHDDARCERISTCLNASARESVELTVARTIAEACAIVRTERFGGVILRRQLAGVDTLHFLHECEERLLTTPIIGLDQWHNTHRAAEYVHAGCCELLDPAEVLQGSVLRRRLSAVISKWQRRAMATIIERQDLASSILGSQEQLVSMARTDALTGLCNRAVFDDMHPVFHQDAIDSGHPYAVVMIDVDRFKQYNDHFGHPAGDEALREIASAIAAATRDEDFVARYGGEELVVLLKDADRTVAPTVADRICSAVEQRGLVQAPQMGGVVTVSVGVAVLDLQKPVPRRALLLAADAALYGAKLRGRNCSVLASSTFTAGHLAAA